MEHGMAGGWTTPGEAPLLYWVIAAIVIVAVVGFAVWAFYLKREAVSLSNRAYQMLGGVVLLIVLASLLIHVSVPASGFGATPTERAWDWKRGETLTDPGDSGLTGEPFRGYQVYIAQGCMYCHTQYLRPQDVVTGWGQGAQEADVSEPGDYANYPAPLWSTQRNGPDLTLEGKRVPLMQWQIDHLVDPRRFQPQSIMPSFKHLPERDLRDLAAYMVSLGNDPDKLRQGQVGPGAQPGGLSPAAEKGLALAKAKGCLACHTTTGDPSVGPTWKALYGRMTDLSDGSMVTADDAYIAQSIEDPAARVVKGFQPVMPSFKGQLTADDIVGIVEYLKTLK